MRTLALVMVGSALLLAGCGTTKVIEKDRLVTRTVTLDRTVTQLSTSAAPEPTVYFASTEGLIYKPDSMSYYGGHQTIERIRWVTYGGAVAVGKAFYGVDDCNPSCAGGHYTYTPITVKLMSRELCKGVPAYSRWSLIGAGLDSTPDLIVGSNRSPCS